MNDKKYTKSLGRRLFFGCFAFVLLICVTMGTIGFFTFRNRLMEQYRERLSEVTNLVFARIDADDLMECIEKGETSEKYDELVEFMDQVMQNYSLSQVALTRPLKEGDKYDSMMVATGLLKEEREGDMMRGIAVPHFGDRLGQYIPPEVLPVYYDQLLNAHEILFNEQNTDFGRSYDAVRSVYDSKGEPVAIFSTGLSLDYLDSVMRRYLLVVIIATVFLCTFAQMFMTAWLRSCVIEPIRSIEKAARQFDENSTRIYDPSALVLDLPKMDSHDELESLSDTLSSMSVNMKNYVEQLLESTRRLDSLEEDLKTTQEKALELTELATRDALTGIRNKLAYDKEVEKIKGMIHAGDTRFGIGMVDLNYLKKINDKFGHEKGNISITRLCHIICVTFDHSPVFRIGGDEFVIIFRGRDYDDREELVERFRNEIDRLSSDMNLPEWERISAAIGVAVYDEYSDRGYDSVFERADEAMYANKRNMKAARE